MSRYNELSDKYEKSNFVPWVEIKALMSSSNITENAFAEEFLTERPWLKKLDRVLVIADIYDFLIGYYDRCLSIDECLSVEELMDEGHHLSRYEAGHAFCRMFRLIWRNKLDGEAYAARLRNHLADKYRSGDEELRTCIVTAIIEHLFESKEIKEFFESWMADPILKVAYSQALEWSDRHQGRN